MVGIQVTKFRIRGGGGGHFLREFKDEYKDYDSNPANLRFF